MGVPNRAKWSRPWRLNNCMYEARMRKHWTIATAANEVGLNYYTYSRYENGERTTCLATYKRIAEVLEVPLIDLLADVYMDDM